MNLFGEDDIAPESLDKFWTQFYQKYPRKKKPGDARKAWTQLQPPTSLAERILADVQLRIENDWKGKDLMYIPYPATYLRSRYWEAPIERHSNGKDITATNHGKFKSHVRGAPGT